jgi:hypothetical protein
MKAYKTVLTALVTTTLLMLCELLDSPCPPSDAPCCPFLAGRRPRRDRPEAISDAITQVLEELGAEWGRDL